MHVHRPRVLLWCVRRDQDRGRSLATALHIARNVTGKEQPTLYVTYCFIIELRINSYGEQLKFMIVIEMFLFLPNERLFPFLAARSQIIGPAKRTVLMVTAKTRRQMTYKLKINVLVSKNDHTCIYDTLVNISHI